MRFRLLVGTHSENNPDAQGAPTHDEQGRPLNTTYKQGEIIETNRDLAKIFNAGPGCETFQRLADKPTSDEADVAHDPEMGNEEDTFDSMDVDQLRQYAVSEEIALGNAKTKAQLLKVIRSYVKV